MCSGVRGRGEGGIRNIGVSKPKCYLAPVVGGDVVVEDHQQEQGHPQHVREDSQLKTRETLPLYCRYTPG